jgi:hypothetical protein
MKKTILLSFVAATANAFINCQSPDTQSRVQTWPSDKLPPGYSTFIDNLRGDLYGLNSNVMPRQIGRKNDIKNPGDYLDGPTLVSPMAIPSLPDSISSSKLKGYYNDAVNSNYLIDDIHKFISNFDNIQEDSSRNEFFGRFIIDGNKVSFGGWYNKFSVIGLYLPYRDSKEFIAIAKSFFKLPDINMGSIKVISEDTIKFYEYLDHANNFRLRGFPITLGPPKASYRTMVIEFTKYYDSEFMPSPE